MIHESFQAKSYWMTTCEYAPNQAFTGRQEVDVAIVGGGFSGLSAAHFLKKEEPGQRIALLEGRVIGYGASGRSGGLSTTLFGLNLSRLARRESKEMAKEAHHYMIQAVDLLQSLISEQNLDCDYEQVGLLQVATSEKYKKRLLEEIAFAHSLGLGDVGWLDRVQLLERVWNPLFMGAWWEPRGGLLNPAKLAWSWKEVIERQGVAVYEQTPVVEMQREKGKIRLIVPWGEILADKLVLASNAYSYRNPWLKRKQRPVWMYAVLTEPLLENQLQEIGWKGREGIEEARPMGHFYRLTPDNRLLIGGGNVPLNNGTKIDQEGNDDAFVKLEKRVPSIFPVLKDIRFTDRWGGLVSIPLDSMPALGYLHDKNVVYSLGSMGHGISRTHLNGKIIADLVLGRRTELTDLFFVNRKMIAWPPEPFGFLAQQAVRGYINLEERYYGPKA